MIYINGSSVSVYRHKPLPPASIRANTDTLSSPSQWVLRTHPAQRKEGISRHGTSLAGIVLGKLEGNLVNSVLPAVGGWGN